jgi:hypothetical protein
MSETSEAAAPRPTKMTTTTSATVQAAAFSARSSSLHYLATTLLLQFTDTYLHTVRLYFDCVALGTYYNYCN